MDTKRLIVALALSLVVLFGWSYLFPPEEAKTPPPAPAAAADAKIEPGKEAAATPGASAAAETLPAQGKSITVKTPLYTAVFNTQGGVLESMVLSKFRESIAKDSKLINIIGDKAKARAAMGVILLPGGGEVHTWNTPGWTYEGAEEVNVAAGAKQTLVFSGEAAGLKLTRKLTIHADTYLISEELTVANPGTAAISGKVAFTAASAGLSPVDDKYNTTRIAYGKTKGGFDEVTSHDDLEKKGLAIKPEDNKVRWGAIESNYFLFILQPQGAQGAPTEEGAQADGRLKDGVFNLALTVPATFEAGQSKTLTCDYFAGPADRSMLAAMPGKMADAVDYGWFHVIALPLLSLLNWFFKYVHNYGIAIILLTVLIKIIFWPLSQKSYKSMEQMKKIQPMLQKIREKYSDDKEKQNAEIMQLYKTYKVNPAGGCVPMLVQIPVFFGLYKALLGSIELRHAPFIPHLPFTDMVWLADLSMKDPYYITPLIMGATMFIQQKMTPTGGDPVQAKVMLFMPVIFTFMFLNFPAGLVVYWMVNNILSIAQQWWMMRKAS